MAINFNTYYAIPRLYTYVEALTHYTKTKPIRGDANETRPCGRREQPWFSIWQDDKDKSIHVGYGRGELSSRQTIVQYHASGVISVRRRNRWGSASTNERMQRLLGVTFKTHQYDTWVKCAWYDNGELRSGWLPTQNNNQRKWDGDDAVSNFVRGEGDNLIFLNYTYPVTHKLNRAALKEVMRPYQPFLAYVEGIRKLQGGDGRLFFPKEVYAEYFGWSGFKDWNGNDAPNYPGSLRYSPTMEQNIKQLFAWMGTDDLDGWMKAALSLAQSGHHTKPVDDVLAMVLRRDRDTVLEATVHKDGKLVKDRYRSPFFQ